MLETNSNQQHRESATSCNDFDDFKNLEYQVQLNLPTLVFRRLRGDMIEMFKHLHCYDKSTLNSRFEIRQRPQQASRFSARPEVPKGRVTWGRTQLLLHQSDQFVERTSEGCLNSHIVVKF